MGLELSIEVLTGVAIKELITSIWGLLKKRSPSEKDLEELRQRIIHLINLSNDTGLALERYTQLLKHATEASVHATELQGIINFSPTEAKSISKQQFMKLITVRMERILRKEGIEEIHPYREDYEKVAEEYNKAEFHLERAFNKFEGDDFESCISEMQYANKELDAMVMFVKRRIDELFEALRLAYKVLETMK